MSWLNVSGWVIGRPLNLHEGSPLPYRHQFASGEPRLLSQAFFPRTSFSHVLPNICAATEPLRLNLRAAKFTRPEQPTTKPRRTHSS